MGHFFYTMIISVFFTVPALAQQTSLYKAKASCEALQKLFSENAALKIRSQYVQVPMSFEGAESKKRIRLLVWKRAGADKTYPPVVFLHGGVAGSSNVALELPRLKQFVYSYPGDFYSLDLRGESCSKPAGLTSDLHPSQYRFLNVINTAKDIEYLRKKGIFGRNAKLRLYGQSRGSAVAHHYFQMFPESVESVHAHGFSIQPFVYGIQGVTTRAYGMLNAWKNYLRKYPDDLKLALKIKNSIPDDKCWVGVDNSKICGKESLGVLGMLLGRVSLYDVIHADLMNMLDSEGNPSPQKINEIIGGRWNKTVYGEYNYVMGVNGYDLASIGSWGAETLRKMRAPVYFEAPFSEIRFLHEAVIKGYKDQSGQFRKLSARDLAENYISMDYAPIVKSMTANPNQMFFLYGSYFDGLSPLPMYSHAQKTLSPLRNFQFQILPNGHEDFDHPAVLDNLMKKN